MIFSKKNKLRFMAYKWLFDQPEGKLILADMCRAHGVFDGGFDPDPYLNAFASGERNVVLRILTIINLTPSEIEELSKEE